MGTLRKIINKINGTPSQIALTVSKLPLLPGADIQIRGKMPPNVLKPSIDIFAHEFRAVTRSTYIHIAMLRLSGGAPCRLKTPRIEFNDPRRTEQD